MRKAEPASDHLEQRRVRPEEMHPELLPQLARCGVLVGFFWLDLPAREFPESAMPLVAGAPAEKEFIAAADDAGDDSSRRGRHGARMG